MAAGNFPRRQVTIQDKIEETGRGNYMKATQRKLCEEIKFVR